jgi:LacI family transcriptional regulator
LVDNHTGARLAVEHLAGRGHRHIGLLAGPTSSPSSQQRAAGFRSALTHRGLPVDDNCIVSGSPTLEGGQESAARLLADHPELTGLLAYNDLMALGAVHACAGLGRTVPGVSPLSLPGGVSPLSWPGGGSPLSLLGSGCAIVGFDDVRLASLVSPALTSVRVDKYQLGSQAVQNLLALLDDPAISLPPVHIGVELVIRAST